MKKKIKLTEMEIEVLQSFCEGDSMYVDHLQGYCPNILRKQFPGVAGSLVKKELVDSWVDEDEGRQTKKLDVLSLTKEGIRIRDILNDQERATWMNYFDQSVK